MITTIQRQQLYALTREKRWHELHKLASVLLISNSPQALMSIIHDADRSLTAIQVRTLIAEAQLIDKMFDNDTTANNETLSPTTSPSTSLKQSSLSKTSNKARNKT